MKAIVLQDFGGTENLIFKDIPTPSIKDDEVLIQSKALSINPVDIKTRSGKGMAGRIKDLMPVVLGWDVSGIVVETGKNVTRFKTGDEVFGMVNFPGLGNAYAEFVAAPASHLALKPANITHEAAAAATLAALTAWQALVTEAKVQPGQRVLIQAAAGGVGHFAVQIAKYLGAYVVGTSSAANKAFVLGLGADEHIDYHTQPLDAAGKDHDFVLDPISGDNIERSFEVMKKGGIALSIVSAFADLVKEKAAAKGINGYFFMVSTNEKDIQSIADLLAKGITQPYVSKIFPFEEMAAAHEALATGRTLGKIIVTV
ncbi:NADP-dependent oxidoreductase [Paraflavitalea soli]|uniref:NADP-dependent oxidoreductase n=1 Tax=Paraflavitalea soli TaxID=2315862 RepID=A0A3B7MQ56_9BACT|nr:NADP-dependent oxidoreductase [Paraflavitalea soli]AXY75449.1 NADP-dependent oxidoreductase [Paraflavitalea soli]